MPRVERRSGFVLEPNAILYDDDLEGISDAAFAAYCWLLFNAWNEKVPGVIPYSPERMARLTRRTVEAWGEIEDELRPLFDTKSVSQSWVSQRLKRSFSRQKENHARLASAGRKGGKSKAERRFSSEARNDALAPSLAERGREGGREGEREREREREEGGRSRHVPPRTEPDSSAGGPRSPAASGFVNGSEARLNAAALEVRFGVVLDELRREYPRVDVELVARKLNDSTPAPRNWPKALRSWVAKAERDGFDLRPERSNPYAPYADPNA